MKNTFYIIQIILSILLIISVLMQQRGTGLGGIFGGEGNVYRSRRGVEKFLFYLTIVLAILFVSTIIISLKI
ncbi:MAG: preprotein translocase subunit SecG [Patescibacteria group bacterium]|jgi:preprotein translocase subunit SecG